MSARLSLPVKCERYGAACVSIAASLLSGTLSLYLSKPFGLLKETSCQWLITLRGSLNCLCRSPCHSLLPVTPVTPLQDPDLSVWASERDMSLFLQLHHDFLDSLAPLISSLESSPHGSGEGKRERKSEGG